MNTELQQESVHGHLVLQMIMESEDIKNRIELVAKIHEKFGAGTTFHNCMTRGLNAESLVDFFVSNQKIQFSSNGLRALCGGGCDD